MSRQIFPAGAAGSPFETWDETRARNISVNGENAIHDDKQAKALGYAGGLVSGVTVFAYLMSAVVRRFGPEALEGAMGRVAFLEPVYDGEPLAIEGQGAALSAGLNLRAARGGTAVAVMEWSCPEQPPAVPALLDVANDGSERPLFDWRQLTAPMPFRGFEWRPTQADQTAWCEGVDEEQALFREGTAPPVHPGLVLQQANNIVSRQFRMTPWIHVSSRMNWVRPLRTGESVQVGALLRECWEKNGHRYGLLEVVLHAQSEVALAIEHKVILQPKGVAAA